MEPYYLTMIGDFVRQSWADINHRLLQNALHPPVFSFTDTQMQLGSWSQATRTLSLSTHLVLNHSETEILDVLCHEMAHQYTEEVLSTSMSNQKPHGDAFRYACQRLNIEHHARYRLESEPEPLLKRIQKLLALAESDNLHEAELAMTKARTLMDKYELELGTQPQKYCYSFLGMPRARRSLVEQLIASLLSRHFSVEVVWIPSHLLITQKKVWLLELVGTKTNLEIAEYVYSFLKRELEYLWTAHRYQHPNLKGIAPKRDFQCGVLQGFIKKLDQAHSKTLSENGTKLILLKKEQLERFFHERHPRLKASRRLTYRPSASYHAGYQQGQDLEIHKGVKNGKSEASLQRAIKRLRG